jgi:hypothetical protein
MPVVPAAHAEQGTSRFHKFLPLSKDYSSHSAKGGDKYGQQQDAFETQRQAVEDYIFGRLRHREEVYDPVKPDVWMYEFCF